MRPAQVGRLDTNDKCCRSAWEQLGDVNFLNINFLCNGGVLGENRENGLKREKMF